MPGTGRWRLVHASQPFPATPARPSYIAARDDIKLDNTKGIFDAVMALPEEERTGVPQPGKYPSTSPLYLYIRDRIKVKLGMDTANKVARTKRKASAAAAGAGLEPAVKKPKTAGK